MADPNAPLRIGLINEYFPPHAVGGAEWSSYYLASGLAQRGHTVVVLTPRFDDEVPREEITDDGVRILRFPFPQTVERGRKARGIFLENPALAPWYAGQVTEAAVRHRLQVLHALNKYAVPWTALAADRLNLPWVATFRDLFHHCPLSTCLSERELFPKHCGWGQYSRCMMDFEAARHAERSGLFKVKYRAYTLATRAVQLWRLRFLRRADAITTVSDRMGDIYRATGINPRIETIHTPLPSDDFPPPVEQVEGRDILYVGKISRGKGADVLLEAFLPLAREDPEARLVYIGENAIGEELETRIREAGLAGRVLFTGRLPHGEVERYYRRAAVTVAPSVSLEAFPRVILESFFAGTPVVSTTRGGMREIVEEGVTGHIVEPAPEALRAAITRVLERPGMRAQVIARREAYLRRFRAGVFEKHEDLYRQLMAQRQHALGGAT